MAGRCYAEGRAAGCPANAAQNLLEVQTLKYTLLAFALVLVLLFVSVQPGRAQSTSVYIGFGTATDSSNGLAIDTFNTGTFLPTPKMTGLFITLGGEFMFKKHLGFGVETSWRGGKGLYSGLDYRPTFYDFNAIWHPVTKKERIVPVIQGGIGGTKVSYYLNQQFCSVFLGCSSSSGLLGSSSHFQLHAAGGLRLYPKKNVFLEPRLDLRYVPNFFQFGRNIVPEYTINLGYTFGQ